MLSVLFHLIWAQVQPDSILTQVASLAGNGLLGTLFLLERRAREKAERRLWERSEKYMTQILTLARSAEKITTTLSDK